MGPAFPPRSAARRNPPRADVGLVVGGHRAIERPDDDAHGDAGLKKFLKKNVGDETLAVYDPKLGNVIKEKLEIDCVAKYAPVERD